MKYTSIEQIKEDIKNDVYDIGQIIEIKIGLLEDNFSLEDLNLFVKPKLNWYNMQIIRKCISKNYTRDFIKDYVAVVDYNQDEIDMINYAIDHNFTEEEMKEFCRAEFDFHIMGCIIDKIEKNKRLETLLYNAISLLVDETYENYADEDRATEWFDMMTNELGCSLSELKEYGKIEL